MSSRTLAVGLLTCCLLISLAPRFGSGQNSNKAAPTKSAAEKKPAAPLVFEPARYPADDPSRAKVAEFCKALERKISPQFDETPLADVIGWFSRELGIPMLPDRAGLLDDGKSLDLPVTLHLDNIPGRSALRLTLEQFQLSYIFENDVLLIVTASTASDRTSTQVYEVSDLVLARFENEEYVSADFTELIDLITNTLPENSSNGSGEWEDNGGPGRIRPFQGEGINALVMRQTRQVHEEVAALLVELRRNRSDSPERRTAPRGKATFEPPGGSGGGKNFGGSGDAPARN